MGVRRLIALVQALPFDAALIRAVRSEQPLITAVPEPVQEPRRMSTPAEIERFMQRVNEG